MKNRGVVVVVFVVVAAVVVVVVVVVIASTKMKHDCRLFVYSSIQRVCVCVKS